MSANQKIDARGPHDTDRDLALRSRLRDLIEEGTALFAGFEKEVRQQRWHPFIAADYESVLQALLRQRQPGLRFLEWGSATGVITIMADLLGFDACGIELDPDLVDVARELASRYGSGARFAAGSFIPAGYRWLPEDGDARTGTIGDGPPAYDDLGRRLEEFDVVFVYPWGGEEPMMRDIMRQHGRDGARLLIHRTDRQIAVVTSSE